METPGFSRLRRFVVAFTALVDAHANDESTMLRDGASLLRTLVAHDDWLPPESEAADPDRYQQHLLWCDPYERFSVVSFVWGPGQQTPVHDHTVWGLIGMLRGEEAEQRYDRDAVTGHLVATAQTRLRPGEVAAVSPSIGDVHRVRNALSDRPSVSIHIYGGNIGTIQRHVFDPEANDCRMFVSGYSLASLPNIWRQL